MAFWLLSNDLAMHFSLTSLVLIQSTTIRASLILFLFLDSPLNDLSSTTESSSSRFGFTDSDLKRLLSYRSLRMAFTFWWESLWPLPLELSALIRGATVSLGGSGGLGVTCLGTGIFGGPCCGCLGCLAGLLGCWGCLCWFAGVPWPLSSSCCTPSL